MLLVRAFVFLLVVFSAPSATLRHFSRTAAPVDEKTIKQVSLRMPLRFEEDRRQTASPVDFLSRGSGYALFLQAGDATLALAPPREKADAAAVRMRVAGANKVAGRSR